MKDVLVLGSGPAGYYASVVCAQNDLDVTLVEKETGGLFRIEHYWQNTLLWYKANPFISYEDLLKDYHMKMIAVQKIS